MSMMKRATIRDAALMTRAPVVDEEGDVVPMVKPEYIVMFTAIIKTHTLS